MVRSQGENVTFQAVRRDPSFDGRGNCVKRLFTPVMILCERHINTNVQKKFSNIPATSGLVMLQVLPCSSGT